MHIHIIEPDGIYFWHAMDILWEKFQLILHLYMEPFNFQSKASDVCLVPTTVYIDV